MKIENQVCSRKQAQRLSELGIEQESEFSYGLFVINEDYEWVLAQRFNQDHGNCTDSFAAFTVAELGEILRATKMLERKPNTLPRPYPDVWAVLGCSEDDKYYPTEAQARAAMLIYLIENGITTPDEVNSKLSN